MSKIGVYKIYFLHNPKKVYIGSTWFERKNSVKTGFYQRKYNHLNSLRKNKHSNIYLQRTFNKYGEESFIFEIIECCKDKYECIVRENFYIHLYDSSNNKIGYNLTKTATMAGYKKTQTQIENHRKSLKKYFEENTVYNKKLTFEFIQNIKNLKEQNYSRDYICQKLGIKKSSYYNALKQYESNIKNNNTSD